MEKRNENTKGGTQVKPKNRDKQFLNLLFLNPDCLQQSNPFLIAMSVQKLVSFIPPHSSVCMLWLLSGGFAHFWGLSVFSIPPWILSPEPTWGTSGRAVSVSSVTTIKPHLSWTMIMKPSLPRQRAFSLGEWSWIHFWRSQMFAWILIIWRENYLSWIKDIC